MDIQLATCSCRRIEIFYPPRYLTLSNNISLSLIGFQAAEEVKPTGPSLDLNNMQPGQAQTPVATCTTSGESNLYPMLGLQTSAKADSKTGINDRNAKTGKQAAASSQEPAAATATAQAAAAAAAAVQAAAAAAADSFLSDKGLIIKTHSPSSPLE